MIAYLQSTDWSMMSSENVAYALWRILCLFVAHKHCAILSANHKLCWLWYVIKSYQELLSITYITYHCWLKIQNSSADDWAILFWVKDHRVCRFSHFANVPPQHLAIGGSREKLWASLWRDPTDIKHWVSVTLFHCRHVYWIRPLASVPEAYNIIQSHICTL